MGIIKKILRTAIVIGIFVWVFLSLPLFVESHGHSHDGHSHHHEENPAHKYSKEANTKRDSPTPPAKESKWAEALLATFLISIAPYLILFVIPITNSKEHEPYLKVLLAFASGSLLGDAFLHLIPHALIAQQEKGGHSHSHSHEEGGHSHDMTVGMYILGGIIMFLVVEKFVRLFKGGHGHSHGAPKKEEGPKNGKKEDKKNGKGSKEEPAQGKLLYIDILFFYYM